MVSSTALTTKVESGSPYQLEKSQVARASSALLKHIKSKQEEQEKRATKKTLIGDDEDSEEDTPLKNEAIWLVLTTKKHVVDKNRLKPGKISIPHSLNASPSLSICLITADPQRSVKNIVADPSFPQHLSSRIDRIIGYSKLKASTMFSLQMTGSNTLGKVFYKSSKRPIPIRIAEIEKVDGKKVKKDPKKKSKDDDSSFASPAIVAKEIEKTLNCAAVQLAPATTAAIRVGSSKFTPEQLAENVEAVVKGLTDKFITKGWRNVKALHIKGANTMAMPIWLASELWVDEGDVVEDVEEDLKAIEGTKNGKKRKQIEDDKKLLEDNKKAKKPKADEDDDALSMAARKEKLQRQKAKALEDGNESGNKKVSNAEKVASGLSKKKRKSIS
ncbi:hypothetical protein KXW15_001115 [Aspergillus fumigatus]|nr:hypothetical protein KXW15_001115 [Aspergillus fumigatus]